MRDQDKVAAVLPIIVVRGVGGYAACAAAFGGEAKVATTRSEIPTRESCFIGFLRM